MADSAASIRAVWRIALVEPVRSSAGAGNSIVRNWVLCGPKSIGDQQSCGEGLQEANSGAISERASHAATIYAQDNSNDLAILHTDMKSLAVASFRFQPRLGEAVATYGFPYFGLLSSSGNFTLGNVTALSGMRDDTRFVQMSTPIQPGNSGGPLLDMSGSVLGIVVSQLSAITMMQIGNSIPQNVNFAIQSPIVINFLSAKGVSPDNASGGGSRRELAPSDVADVAKKFTVQIYCQGSSPKVLGEADRATSASSWTVQQR